VAEFEADVDGSMESLPRLSRRRGAGAASAFWTWRTWDRAVREYAQGICRV